MAENKKGFVLYADLLTVVKKLVEQDRQNGTNYAGELFLMILEYVNDLNPVPVNFIVDMAFEPIKLQLKRDLKKYEVKKEQWSKAGKKSAEIRSTKSTDVNGRSKRSTDSTVIVTDTVKDTVTVKDKVKDNVKYNFRVSLLDFGFDVKLVDEWLIIRKNKKASNTETAFEGFVKQVNLTGMDKNEVLRVCVEKSWAGLKAEWIKKEPDQGSKIVNFLNNIEQARTA